MKNDTTGGFIYLDVFMSITILLALISTISFMSGQSFHLLQITQENDYCLQRVIRTMEGFKNDKGMISGLEEKEVVIEEKMEIIQNIPMKVVYVQGVSGDKKRDRIATMWPIR